MQGLLNKIDQIKKKWDALHPLEPSLLKIIQEKLRATWTYHSNAIEGNSLTLGETIFYLKEGLTSEGKPLKDYLEVKNHAEAIDYLYDVIKDKRPITEGLIKELNALLLKGTESTPAKTPNGQLVQKKTHPGEYKKEPNHVLTLSGHIHRYVEPIHVPTQMETLLKEYHQSPDKRHPITRAADLHYGLVKIHPFDDCNGRVARLMMNLSLMKDQFPPAVIPIEKRKAYLTALEKADQGELTSFYKIVGESLLATLELYLKEVQ